MSTGSTSPAEELLPLTSHAWTRLSMTSYNHMTHLYVQMNRKFAKSPVHRELLSSALNPEVAVYNILRISTLCYTQDIISWEP